MGGDFFTAFPKGVKRYFWVGLLGESGWVMSSFRVNSPSHTSTKGLTSVVASVVTSVVASAVGGDAKKVRVTPVWGSDCLVPFQSYPLMRVMCY